MRQLNSDHGGERGEENGDELSWVTAIMRVHQMNSY